MANVNKVQEALAAIQKIETLKQEAVQELLAERAKIDDQLSQLGHDNSKPAKKRTQREKDPNAPCSICKFVTDPPHDGRVHRSQETKKPFTAKELEERGYKRR